MHACRQKKLELPSKLLILLDGVQPLLQRHGDVIQIPASQSQIENTMGTVKMMAGRCLQGRNRKGKTNNKGARTAA